MVFAIGDQQQDAGHVAGRAEPLDCFANGFFEARAASPHAVGSEGVEHKTKKPEVGGHRRKDTRASRECDEANLVSREVFEQVANLGLRAFEPVRCDVFRQHRARYIEGDHELSTDLRTLDVFEAPLGSHQGQHGEKTSARTMNAWRARRCPVLGPLTNRDCNASDTRDLNCVPALRSSATSTIANTATPHSACAQAGSAN